MVQVANSSSGSPSIQLMVALNRIGSHIFPGLIDKLAHRLTDLVYTGNVRTVQHILNPVQGLVLKVPETLSPLTLHNIDLVAGKVNYLVGLVYDLPLSILDSL